MISHEIAAFAESTSLRSFHGHKKTDICSGHGLANFDIIFIVSVSHIAIVHKGININATASDVRAICEDVRSSSRYSAKPRAPSASRIHLASKLASSHGTDSVNSLIRVSTSDPCPDKAAPVSARAASSEPVQLQCVSEALHVHLRLVAGLHAGEDGDAL